MQKLDNVYVHDSDADKTNLLTYYQVRSFCRCIAPGKRTGKTQRNCDTDRCFGRRLPGRIH